MQYNSLKNCITTLERLRDATDSQLDASVLLELDTVIAELKKHSEHHENFASLSNLSTRVLEVTNQVILLVSNISDWMK